LARALDLHSRGHRFDSDILHKSGFISKEHEDTSSFKDILEHEGLGWGLKQEAGFDSLESTDPLIRVKFIDMLEEKQSYKRNAEG
jgi:hypothetical protein